MERSEAVGLATSPLPPDRAKLAPGTAAARDAVDAAIRVADDNAAAPVNRQADRPGRPRQDGVLPTGTAVVPSSGPSVPGTGGGNGGTDPQATGMAVGSVLLIGVGLIAAGVALVGLRNRRDTPDHSH